jgi:hypothetical protein
MPEPPLSRAVRGRLAHLRRPSAGRIVSIKPDSGVWLL